MKKPDFRLQSGIKAVGLLAISDQGTSYNQPLAEQAGNAVLRLHTREASGLIATVIRASDLRTLGAKVGAT